jgi:hypothetical protein
MPLRRRKRWMPITYLIASSGTNVGYMPGARGLVIGGGKQPD